ncbi:M15 family metallopeptidase [Jiulongibacter sp. NS-SX5]|uniref:M15 family metallopeptidase n=1 Tax=Jiulongibacter sp. NS-SX5 TaxID=3463854 RepID=UPI004057EA4D
MIDPRLKYADAITLNRIRFLHPAIREKVREAYLTVNYKLLGKGVRLRFPYTHRTNETQDRIYAQGRTVFFDFKGNRLGIVTYAKGGQSIHNYGLAWDIVLLLDKDGSGSFETASWDVTADYDGDLIADWLEVVEYFKSELGATWGGDWTGKKVDKPHFQLDFGFSWRQLKERLLNRAITEEVIDGVKYEWVRLD